ncbi:hypothetical protein [Pilimelia columellifera]
MSTPKQRTPQSIEMTDDGLFEIAALMPALPDDAPSPTGEGASGGAAGPDHQPCPYDIGADGVDPCAALGVSG